MSNERTNERPLPAELVRQETEQDGAEHNAEVEDHLRGFWKEVLLAHKVPLKDTRIHKQEVGLIRLQTKLQNYASLKREPIIHIIVLYAN